MSKLPTSYESAMRQALKSACKHDEFHVTALPALLVNPPIFQADVRCLYCEWRVIIQWQHDRDSQYIVSRADFEGNEDE